MDDRPATPMVSFQPGTVIRPSPVLLKYFLICAVCTGPAFPFVFLALYFRYITLRYRFDADEDGGVWMARGILFKKEVSLTYRRIQDIHVSRNFIERWMGLARVAVQTASSSSSPEMTVEGVLDADALRDFLYQHMRGAKGLPPDAPEDASAHAESGGDDEALALLREVRDALADLRDCLDAGARP